MSEAEKQLKRLECPGPTILGKSDCEVLASYCRALEARHAYAAGGLDSIASQMRRGFPAAEHIAFAASQLADELRADTQEAE